jgi:hypothetical protein
MIKRWWYFLFKEKVSAIEPYSKRLVVGCRVDLWCNKIFFKIFGPGDRGHDL